MSRKGNCWDNAVAESFFHTLKTQLIYHIRLNNFEEAERILFKYIEVYYNQRRKHSTNGWKSPARYEQEWYNLENVA
jgi:putative transposase